MKLSLDVLKHLGLNLYSNVPAVLSEIVANSWDADANNVRISVNGDVIVITDDGTGMTRDEVIDRFLLVGYQRRVKQAGPTKLGRSPMGRKGIGKLSLLSIARDIVVETRQDSNKTALGLSLEKIESEIKSNGKEYYPDDLPTDSIDFQHGTRITLSNLRKKFTSRSDDWLRQRLARRFSIIGEKEKFSVFVNDRQIMPEDRGYYDKLQYIWTYGDQAEIVRQCGNLDEDAIDRSEGAGDGEIRSLSINGWLGTAKESSQLKVEGGENLNRIAIFVRGKMAQEDLLSDFSERGVYASYLVGELRVDGLDTATCKDDEDDDSATTGRQSLVEDDPRYVALSKFIGTELKHIKGKWSELRTKEGIKQAVKIPAINEWLDSIPSEQQGKAKLWIGKINQLNIASQQEKNQLIKHAAIAFEFYRTSKNLEALDAVSGENIEELLAVFADMDSLEIVLYGEIVKERLEIIKTIRNKVEAKALERVIQEYIFDHLWLLDPAWERTIGSETLERSINTILEGDADYLTDEERRSRIDIQYRTATGTHVIVELKRPGINVSVYDLAKQVNRYRASIKSALEENKATNERIDIICVLGEPPLEWSMPDGQQTVINVLDSADARFITYSELLHNAEKAYTEFQENTEALRPLQKVISALDNFANGSGS